MSRAKESRQRILLIKSIVRMVLLTALVGGCYNNAPTAVPGRRPSGTFGNGAETLAYVKTLGFTGAGSLRSSYDCAACPGGKIQLLIMPDNYAQNRNWQADLGLGAPGDVVAQVMNIDTVTFGELNLAPGDVAYAWVGQIAANGTANNRGFGIYKIDENGTTVASWSVVNKSMIKFCPHDTPWENPSVKPSHEGLGPCTPIAAAPDVGKNRLAGLGISEAYGATARAVSTAMFGLGGLWITCSGGCCQVSTT